MAVITDPPNAYTPNLTYWSKPLEGVNVWVHSNLPGGGGPDCELFIYTNSGLRYANLGHPPPAPPAPAPDDIIQSKANCFKTRLPGPKQWLEATWRVNPPPYELMLESLHVWEAVVRGVEVGTRVDLAVVDRSGQAHVLTTVASDALGLASFRVATSRDEHIAVGADRGFGNAALFVSGALLEAVARFVPRAGATDAAVVGTGAGARVLVAAGDQVLLLDLRGKAHGLATVPGVRHVAALGNRLVAHAGVHVAELQPAGKDRLAVARTWQATQEITNFQARGTQLLLTLRDGSAVTLDRGLVPAAQTARPRAETWLAEPWLRTPMRAGNVAARVENGAVLVYRYMQTAVF